MRLLLIGLILFSAQAHARMYQWIDPDTGTTQLSGKPPGWYRSAEAGPRVFVFAAGRVIDDTSIRVSDRERELLRQRAFVKAEEDETAAREKLARANKLKEGFGSEPEVTSGQEQEVLPEQTGVFDIPDAEPVAEEETTRKSGVTARVLEEMRALIVDWEKKQSKSAHALLEKSSGTTTEPSLSTPAIPGSVVPGLE